jgi:endoglucanase
MGRHPSRRVAVALAAAAGVVLLAVVVGGVLVRDAARDRFDLPLDVPPDSAAARAVSEHADELGPEQERLLRHITTQPTSRWISSPTTSVQREVRSAVAGAAERDAMAALVAYAIPGRDCGGHSAGGVDAASDYQRWVDAFVAGLGSHRAVVVVEPDALAQVDCLSEAARSERERLLAYALSAVSAQGSLAYVDAGHSGWVGAKEMARRLATVGVQDAAGFSLNVSNFRSTEEEIEYGEAISDELGGDVRFLIDTSRNGGEPTEEWCNPSGQALGAEPTTRTASRRVDAYLWIKTPGLSDGECNGGPPAGQWWTDYALGLVVNAGFG